MTQETKHKIKMKLLADARERAAAGDLRVDELGVNLETDDNAFFQLLETGKLP